MTPRTLRILYFAAARERVKSSAEVLSFAPAEGPSSVDALLALLGARHPALVPLMPYLRVAVNQEMVAGSAPLPEGAEVALIPPVAGG
jgi:molybdopterin synthase catalytic subunit